MGVNRAFELVSDHYTPTSIVPRDVGGHKHIDMNSIILGYINNTLRNMMIRNWRKPPDKRESIQALIKRVGLLVDKKLLTYFSRESSTLHFDGEHTVEKAETHTERLSKFDKQVEDADVKITKTSAVILNQRTPGTPTSSERTKIVAHSKNAITAWKKARSWSLDSETKVVLAEVLGEQGWQVHLCLGETDTCISQQDDAVVVSTDSDYLFRDIKALIRKDPRSHDKYTLYSIDDMVTALGMRRNGWKVVGMTSGNDYSKNLSGFGIKTNYNAVSSINAMPGTTAHEILEVYCATHVNDQQDANQVISRFKNAERVFGSNAETIAVDQTSKRTTKDLDQKLERMLSDVHQALQGYRRHHRNRTSNVTTASTQVHSASSQPPTRSRDGYLQLMPGNKFRAKVYKSKEKAAENPPGTPIHKKKKRKKDKKRKREHYYDPSSKQQRRDPSEDSSAKKTGRVNRLKPASIIQNCLGKYATITMDCGTLSAQLKRGLETHSVVSINKQDEARKEIEQVIQEMVRIGTELTRCAQQALSLYIAKTTADFPTLEGNDIANRKEGLRHVGYFSDTAFFGNLLQDLFSWHDKSRGGRPRKNTPANDCIKDILDVYRGFLQEANSNVPYLKNTIKTGLGLFLQQVGVRFGDTLQIHFKCNISELRERVREHNGDWVMSDEGRLILASINDQGVSDMHDPISLFWILNSHLPTSKQIVFLPEGGFTDNFFTITEDTLLMALLRQESKAWLKTEFGSQEEARRHAAEHPGDLMYRLFFTKRLSYIRGSSLINPGANLPSRLALFDLEGNSKSVYDDHITNMHDADSTIYPAAKKAFQEYINKQLTDPMEQKLAIDQGAAWRKYVLTGSISTNGHELKVLAHSLTRAAPSPSARKRPNTTRAKLNDVKTTLATKDDVKKVFQDQSSYIVVGIDPGVKSTATCCILDSNNMDRPKNITISQGSHTFPTKKYLQGLEHAKGKAGIHQLENTITAVECPSAEVGQQGAAWRQLQLSIQGHIRSVLQVQDRLRRFYLTKILKIKSYQRKQALSTVTNKGIDRVIAATGCKGKPEEDSVRPLFVVGDGQFGTNRGETLHQQFISLLKKKVNDVKINHSRFH